MIERLKKTLNEMPFRAKLAIILFFVGFVFMAIFLANPERAAYVATEILIGKGFIFSIICLAILLLCSPLRCSNNFITIIHSVICGIVSYWFLFVIFQAELSERYDTLWVFVSLFFFTTILLKLFFADAITYSLCKILLMIQPGGELIIRFFSAIWETDSINYPNRLFNKFMLLYTRSKKMLGLANYRSFPIEKAFQSELEEKLSAFREMVKQNEYNEKIIDSTLMSLKAELLLNAIIIKGSGKNLEKEIKLDDNDVDSLFERMLSVWNHFIFLKQSITSNNIELNWKNNKEKNTNLDSKICFLIKIVESFFSELNEDSSLLNEAYKNYKEGINYQYLFSKFERLKDIDKISNKIALIFFADIFLINDLHVIVINIANELLNLKNKEWLNHAINRIKSSAEKQLLRCKEYIADSTTISILKIDEFIASSNSDCIEEKKTEDDKSKEKQSKKKEDTIPEYLKNNQNKYDWKSIVFQAPIKRTFINLGLDKIIIAFCLSFIVAFIGLQLTIISPLGKPIKQLNDIHRVDKYTNYPINCVDVLPDKNMLIIGTNGGGLHKIKTNTFYVQSTKNTENGLATNWVNKVAVASNGSILSVVTENPDKAKNSEPGTGLSFQDKNGNWTTFITPSSVEELNGNDLTSVIDFADKKIISVNGKILSYDSNKRLLKELSIVNPETLSPNEKITKLLVDANTKDKFVALTSVEGNNKIHSVYFVHSLESDNIKLTKLFHEDIDDNIAEATFSNSSLQIRTQNNQLFKYQNEWEYICGNFPQIDVEDIINIAVKEKPFPTIWFITKSTFLKDSYIYMCILSDKRILPSTPWASCNLSKGLKCQDGKIVYKSSFDFSKSILRFDEESKRYEMIVPGKRKDLFVFQAPVFPVSDNRHTNINCKRISFEDKQIKWIDSNEKYILTILYDDKNKTQSISEWKWNKDHDSVELAKEIQNTSLDSFLNNKKILTIVTKESNDGFYAICKDSTILEYSTSLRGWMDTSSIKFNNDEDIKLKKLLSATSSLPNRAYILDKNNSIYELNFPENNIASYGIDCKLIHSPSKERPAHNSDIAYIATENEDIILFLENHSKKDQGIEAWGFQTKASENHLFGWIKEKMPSGKNLRKGSITRLQAGSIKGHIIAIDTDGNLVYRQQREWFNAEGLEEEKWNEIKNTKGGTFVSNEKGIALIKYNENNCPSIANWCWKANSIEKLTLPIDDIAALYDGTGNSKLLIGSKEGLFYYDLENHNWEKLIEEQNRDNTWKFYKNKSASNIWAIQKNNNGISYYLVSYSNLQRFNKTNIKAITPAGNGLLIELNDKTLIYTNDQGIETTIVSGIREKIGNGTIVKNCKISEEKAISLTSEGKLFSITGNNYEIDSVDISSIKNKIVDISCNSSGDIFVVTENNEFYIKEQGSPNFEIKKDKNYRLTDRLNDSVVVAANPSKSHLEIYKNLTNKIIASGMNDWPLVGTPQSYLLDGDNIYISGNLGTAKHNIDDTFFISIKNGNSITRYEKYYNDIIGWKGNIPYLLKDQGFDKIKAGSESNKGYSIFQTKDSLGILNKSDKNLYSFKDNKPLNLFSSNANLGTGILDAVSVSNTITALKGDSGNLVLYDHTTHNYNQIAKADTLGTNWRFIQINGITFIASNDVKANGAIFKLNNNSLENISKNIREVYKAPRAIYWINNDFQIGCYQNELKPLLPSGFKSYASNKLDEILYSNNLLFCKTKSGEAHIQDLISGESKGIIKNIDSLGIAGNEIIGIERNGQEFVVKDLKRDKKISNNSFTRYKQGTNNIFVWKEENQNTKFELIGQKSLSGTINNSQFRTISSLSSEEWLALDNNLYFLNNSGNICQYDFGNSKWIRPDEQIKYSEIGLFNNSIIAISKKATENEIGIYSPNNLKLEKKININGQFMFSKDDYITQKNENKKLEIGTEDKNGYFKPLLSFVKSIEQFDYKRAFINKINDNLIFAYFPNSNSSCNTFLIKKNQENPIPIREPLIKDLSPNQTIIKFDEKNIYIQPNSYSNNVVIINYDKTEITTEVKNNSAIKSTGNIVWIQENNSSSLKRIYRAKERKSLELIRNTENISTTNNNTARKTEYAVNSKYEDRIRQLREKNNITQPEPKELINAVFEMNQIKITDSTDPNNIKVTYIAEDNGRLVSSNSPINVKPGSTSINQSLKSNYDTFDIFGKKLLPNGWFTNNYPKDVKLSNNRQLSITFFDNTNKTINLIKDYSTKLSKPQSSFKIENEMIFANNGKTKIGLITNPSCFSCDKIQDVIPTSDYSFIIIDKNFQLWHWKNEFNNWRRTHIILEKTNLPFQLELGKENNTYVPVILKSDKSLIAKYQSEKPSYYVNNISICTKLGKENGRYKKLVWQNDNDEMSISATVKLGSNLQNLPISSEKQGLCLTGTPTLIGEESKEEPSVAVEIFGNRYSFPVTSKSFDDKMSNLSSTSRKYIRSINPSFTKMGINYNLKDNYCEIKLNNNDLQVKDSRFAHDIINHIATLNNKDYKTLFVESALSGYLVKINWNNKFEEPNLVKLPENSSLYDLRVRNNKLYTSFDGKNWYVLDNNWQKTNIDWDVSGSSPKWNLTQEKKITREGFEQDLAFKEGKIAFESETFSTDLTDNGYCCVVNSDNGIIYKTLNSKWYEYNTTNYTKKKASPQKLPDNKILELSTGIYLPERCKTDKNYYFKGTEDLKLPLIVRNGRMSHENTTGEIIRTSNSFLLPLVNSDFSRLHPLNENQISKWNLTKVKESDSGNSPYEPDKKLILTSNKEVSWMNSGKYHYFNLINTTENENSRNRNISLGYITDKGLQISDHNEVNPVEVYENNIDYIFNNRVLRKHNSNKISDISISSKYENTEITNSLFTLKYNQERNDFDILFNTKDSSNDFYNTILGEFDKDGKYNSEKSWTIDTNNGNKKEVLVLSQKFKNMQIPFAKNDESELFANSEYPIDIAISINNQLALLGKSNASLCLFEKENDVFVLTDYERISKDNPLTKLHYSDSDLYAISQSKNPVFCKLSTKPLTKDENAQLASISRDLPTDCFGFKYDLNLLLWKAYLKDDFDTEFQSSDLSTLPGINVSRVHYNYYDIIMTDPYLHNIIGSNTKKIWLDNTLFTENIRRCFDNLMIGDYILSDSYALCETDSIFDCPLGTWNLKTKNDYSNFEITGHNSKGEITILRKSKDYNKNDKNIDFSPICLAKNKNNSKVLFTYGLEQIDISTDTAFIESEMNYTIPSTNIELVSDDSNFFIRTKSDSLGICLENAQVKIIPQNAKEYMYKDNDWIIEHSNNKPIFRKQLHLSDGNKSIMEIPLDLLFVKGQFAFDRIKSVFFYQPNVSLMIESYAGYETIIEQGSSNSIFDYLPSENEKENIAYLSKYNPRMKYNINIDNNYYQILDISFKDKLSEKAINILNINNKLNPSYFYSDGKCWVVLPDSVRWVEQGLRWKPKLLFYR